MDDTDINNIVISPLHTIDILVILLGGDIHTPTHRADENHRQVFTRPPVQLRTKHF